MKQIYSLIAVLLFSINGSLKAQEVKIETKREFDGLVWKKLENSDFNTGAQLMSGKVVIPLSMNVNFIYYNSSVHMFETSQIVDDKSQRYFINLNGDIVIDLNEYEQCYPSSLSDEYAFFEVKKNGKYGILDERGEFILPLEYDHIMMNEAGHFIYEKNGIKGACDFSGKPIISLNEGYNLVLYRPIGDCYSVHKGSKHRGVLNRDGSVRIPLDKYDICNVEDEGYITVKKDKNYGICDLSGKEIIKPKYDYIFYSDEGFITYEREGQKKKKLGNKLSKKTLAVLEKEESRKQMKELLRQYESATDLDKELKELFEKVYEMPDANVNVKLAAYREIIDKDPLNKFGYSSNVYNNMGVLYYNSGNRSQAHNCFEKSVAANPYNEKAKENLKSTKSELRAERWEAIADGLAAFGEGLQNYSASQQARSTSGSYNNSSSSESFSGTISNSSSSSSSSSSSKKVNSQLVMSLSRSYDNYESRLAKMKSGNAGSYTKEEVRSIQKEMKEVREKYNKESGRTRSISPYESWNP